MNKLVFVLFVVLLVAHQDFWFWDDATLVLGFMPIGLFYHAVYALAAAGLGVLAVRYIWPHSADEEEADAGDDAESKVELSEADLDLLD